MSVTRRSRPFRFGVQISRARGSAEWREQARRAEALGYDVFLMPDHFGAQFAIGPALAAVAAAAATIRIGTLVWQNDLRHPALLAKEIATLDVLSDGRFEIGIGAGGSFPPEFDWTGIPFDPPGRRVGRLEESVHLLKAMLGEEPVTHTGEYFALSDYQGLPKPVQRPHPPLFIAGGGPRMLALAAREADIIGILPAMLPAGGFAEGEETVDAYARKIAFIREQAGERFDRIELNVLIQMVAVSDDRRAAMDRLRAERELPDDAWFASPMAYVGSVDEIVDKLCAMRETLGVSYFAVFEPVMEEFAPVVRALAGA